MPNGGRVSVLPWAGGPDPSPPRWGLTTWLSAPPTLAADVFGRSPLGSVDECVAVQLRARWPLTVHTWKEPEREALGRARALPLRGSRGQKAGARSSGAGPSPACPLLAARVLKGRGRGHPHHVVNKPAINEGRGVITLPSCSSLPWQSKSRGSWWQSLCLPKATWNATCELPSSFTALPGCLLEQPYYRSPKNPHKLHRS